MQNITTIIAHKDYNDYLLDALNSALEQTYMNHQVCVIDDGSKENPIELLSSYGPFTQVDNIYQFNRFTLIVNKESVGPAKARNIGIKHFYEISDAFHILDADDIAYPEKLMVMYPYLDDNVGVVYADYCILDVDTNVSKMEFKHNFDNFILQNNCIVHSGALISKRALESVKISNDEWYLNKLRTCEDYNLWLRIAKKYIIYHVPYFLTKVREHQQNSTNTVNQQRWAQDIQTARSNQ